MYAYEYKFDKCKATGDNTVGGRDFALFSLYYLRLN
jgi:hypothetical protein